MRRGFNAIVASLPGISRSVLARRLRKLEVLGLVARAPAIRGSRAIPLGARRSAARPDPLSLAGGRSSGSPKTLKAHHDPDVIVFWLTLRADPSAARISQRSSLSTAGSAGPQHGSSSNAAPSLRYAWRIPACRRPVPALRRLSRSLYPLPADSGIGRWPWRIGLSGCSATRAHPGAPEWFLPVDVPAPAREEAAPRTGRLLAAG